jgi:glycosyltransferase involved in cell wall biosynthesis
VPRHYADPLNHTPQQRISVVTASFNQGDFIARTVKSLLEQGYPHLEYIVQDGGSQDGTVAALEPFVASFAHFDSAPDGGFAQGLNLGFQHATGDILAYLNSDDVLLPGALGYVAAYFDAHPDVDVVYGHRVVIDEYDAEIGRWVLPPHDDEVLSWADYVPQETLFWRRKIWEQVGAAVDESFRFAVDWDLLVRFREVGAKMHRLPRFLGGFRVHPHQKTSAEMQSLGNSEMDRIRERCHGRRVSPSEVDSSLRPYLRKHILFHKLYRLGVLRY